MRLALRVIGAALLGVNAGIHASLWSDGYRTLPVIGPSFLVAAVSASLLGVLVLVTPERHLAVVSLAGAGLEAGTAGALLIAWSHSLFGFMESPKAALFGPAFVTETAGILVLGGLAALTVGLLGRIPPHQRRAEGV